jgi:hypothetical protein
MRGGVHSCGTIAGISPPLALSGQVRFPGYRICSLLAKGANATIRQVSDLSRENRLTVLIVGMFDLSDCLKMPILTALYAGALDFRLA